MDIAELQKMKRKAELEIASFAIDKIKEIEAAAGVYVSSVDVSLIYSQAIEDPKPKVVSATCSIDIEI